MGMRLYDFLGSAISKVGGKEMKKLRHIPSVTEEVVVYTYRYDQAG
jgi:hypothetical protein